MRTIKKKMPGKRFRTVFLAICIMALVTASAGAVFAAETGTQTEAAAAGEDQGLLIEVVEDIPAEEIDDEEVPLAAPGDTSQAHATSGKAYAVVLVVVIAALGTLTHRKRRQRQNEISALSGHHH